MNVILFQGSTRCIITCSCYLALVTDAYSKKIMGYDVPDSLATEGAFRMLGIMLYTSVILPKRSLVMLYENAGTDASAKRKKNKNI